MEKTAANEFVRRWVSENVHTKPGLQSVTQEVARLRSGFEKDAKANGTSKLTLDESVGDIDDFLTNEYEKIYDPDLGFKN